MDVSQPKTKLVRFGLFEVDLEQRRLTKGGLRVKLQDQPFQVLALLLERPGEVITRDDIRQKLWPSDTFVEFDDGLNTAIKKVRAALSDSSDNPKFIETVPRRGYRFLAPVSWAASGDLAKETSSRTVLNQNIQSTEVLIAEHEHSRIVIENVSLSKATRFLGIVAVLMTIAATAGYVLWLHSSAKSGKQKSEVGVPAIRLRPSVAVIGFRNLSGRSESEWLSVAITEMLSTELEAGRMLRLVSAENIVRTKRELALVNTDSLSPDILLQLHKNLGADFVILGSYTSIGKPGAGRIRLDVHLLDARTGEAITANAVSGQDDRLFELINDAGAQLRQQVGAGALSSVQLVTIRASLPTSSAAARFYADGLSKLRGYDYMSARDLLQRAVSLEPSHALAHSALAAAWKPLGYDSKAQDEAKKAWELSSGVEREKQLWIEGYYRETIADWDRAIEIYRTLSEFFPDDVEYGLRLAETQSTAGKASDALLTISRLGKLPKEIADDPRLDLQEAFAANQLSDYQHLQRASASAATKAAQRGARLLLAQAKLYESTAARNLKDLDGARQLDDAAQHIYEDLDDKYGATRARLRLSDLLWQEGQIADSDAIAEQCLKVFRALGAKREMAFALDGIGGGLIQLGHLDEATRYYDEALAVQREIGNKRGVAMELNNIGVILQQKGDLNAALKTDEETRDAYRTIGDDDGLSSALNNIAEIRMEQGDLAEAKKMFTESLLLREKLANESDVAESLHNLAELLRYTGDVAESEKKYDAALAIRQRRGAAGAVAESQVGKADLFLDMDKATEAEPLARAAAAQFKNEQQISQEASARATLAEALLRLGKLEEAKVEIVHASDLDMKNADHETHLKTEIVASEILSIGSPDKALSRLRIAIHDAEASGLFVRKLQASLTALEIEMKSGRTTIAHSRSETLQKEAAAKGFLLFSRKAANIMANQ
jgi:DNA-binding winged helix-turn-helix (wHTH) protein/tetratricopeptide (TPR) repeat protein